jgi:tRNA pseudouridine55 synthase
VTEGWLLVDKPAGPTSHDVVAAARKALGTREIGHAGTLDPQATGLLLLAVGRATALLQFTAFDKGYRAVARLGIETDTLDAAGKVLRESRVTCTPEAARDAFLALRGARKQRPPMVSAVKVAGKRLHALAREGKEVERPERDIEVSRVGVSRVELPDVEFDLDVSGGTYVRSLAEEAGRALGCGAHLLSLRRTRIGPFRVEDAVAPDTVAPSRLLPLHAALAHLPQRELSPAEATGVSHGRPVPWTGKGLVRLHSQSSLVAIAEGDGKKAQPRRVLAAQ